MKKLLMASLLATAVAYMAAAQCPGHGDMGAMVEKKEIRVRMDRDGDGPGMRHMGMGRSQWWENPMVIKELGLTDKQSEQIDQLSLNHRKNVIKLEADLKIAEIEFQDLMEGEPNEADVRKKAKAISQLREKLQDLRVEHLLAVRKVLTPEQQKKLKDIKHGMRKNWMQMEPGDCHRMPNSPEAPEAPKAPR
jgi:Spy/CpxP family protein refolding chaperone